MSLQTTAKIELADNFPMPVVLVNRIDIIDITNCFIWLLASGFCS
ncbi:MAG: hypothetical protein WD431_11525 [Cyclobacteriaceae bacterium]